MCNSVMWSWLVWLLQKTGLQFVLNMMTDEEFVFAPVKISGVVKYEAKQKSSGEHISFMLAMDLLQRGDPNFVKAFLAILRTSVQYEAYFFETPPMTEMKVC